MTSTVSLNQTASFTTAFEALKCKECGAEYEAKAIHVCEQCFGPLEVKYNCSSKPSAGKRSKQVRIRFGAIGHFCRSQLITILMWERG